jgi:hypothetical protein
MTHDTRAAPALVADVTALAARVLADPDTTRRARGRGWGELRSPAAVASLLAARSLGWSLMALSWHMERHGAPLALADEAEELARRAYAEEARR